MTSSFPFTRLPNFPYATVNIATRWIQIPTKNNSCSSRAYRLYADADTAKDPARSKLDQYIVAEAFFKYNQWKWNKAFGKKRIYQFLDAPNLELAWFGVRNDLQGQKIGTQFLQYVLQDVELNWNCGLSELWICDVSCGSGIYTRCGFSEGSFPHMTYRTYQFSDTVADRVKKRRLK